MISAWTKHLSDPKDKEQFRNSVLGSKTVLNRLKALLDEEEADLIKAENDYTNPNWDYRQADANGYRRCIRKIQKIINLDHKE
jgi:hypothetical protein